MKRIQVQSEISQDSYKQLVAKMRKLDRDGLWKVLDHYIFHTMKEDQIQELLKILESFASSSNNSLTEDGKNLIQASVSTGNSSFRLKLPTEITAEDLRRSSDFLDIMYDEVYFTYLDPAVKQINATKLVEYAKRKELPIQPHWEEISKESVK